MEFAKVYPMDAVYDTPEEVPEDVSSSKTLSNLSMPLALHSADRCYMALHLEECAGMSVKDTAPLSRLLLIQAC